MISAYTKKRCATFPFETGIHFRRKTDFFPEEDANKSYSGFEPEPTRTITVGSDVVQSGRPIFDDFFQHLWPYIGNNTANVVLQMVKRLWLIRIDQ
ncbi:hypothetical protein TNCV_2072751 [Trichonephila clavipes]|nr:hypothetical protein TNCV_2072751 [Trichonephila clavipes]